MHVNGRLPENKKRQGKPPQCLALRQAVTGETK